jgi:choline-sulfatase
MAIRLLLLASIVQGRLAASKNFIFFQPDEMRAESLGCYGHPVSKTPNFDKFAAEGTRFDQAHVSYTVCSQSRASFATGWPTHVAGHRSLWALLQEWEPNMFKYFKQEGYTVKWWGKNDMLAEAAWNSSVTSAESIGAKGNDGANAFKFGEPGYMSFLSDALPYPVNESQDYSNVLAAIEFLQTKPTEPFVIYLPLSKPHPPYSAPEPFYSLINASELPALKTKGAGKPDYHALIRQYRELEKPVAGYASLDAFFRKLHAVYLGSISFSDHLFGLLMAAVEENGFEDSTTVAVWADHGDYAGDYGLVEKWPSGLEDVLTRVPLIVRTPGGSKGHVVKEPVQLFDIVPTFLEVANISSTHVHFGKSLVSQLQGSAGDANRVVFAEGGYATFEKRDNEGDESHGFNPNTSDKSQIYYPKALQQHEHPESVMRAVSARSMTHKLVLRSDPSTGDHCSELYDLQADPSELHNLYGNMTHSAIQAELTSKILTWFLHTSDVTPWSFDKRGLTKWPPQSSLSNRGPMIGGARGPHDFAEHSPPAYGPHITYHI